MVLMQLVPSELLPVWQVRTQIVNFNLDVAYHNRFAQTIKLRRCPSLDHIRPMMLSETEIHKALLAVQDREYRFVLDYCQKMGFDMPIQGPIAYRWSEVRAYRRGCYSAILRRRSF